MLYEDLFIPPLQTLEMQIFQFEKRNNSIPHGWRFKSVLSSHCIDWNLIRHFIADPDHISTPGLGLDAELWLAWDSPCFDRMHSLVCGWHTFKKYNNLLLSLTLIDLLVCLPSSVRCKNGMNHLRDRVPHMADGLCQYSHQYNNKVLICKVRQADRHKHTHCVVPIFWLWFELFFSNFDTITKYKI